MEDVQVTRRSGYWMVISSVALDECSTLLSFLSPSNPSRKATCFFTSGMMTCLRGLTSSGEWTGHFPQPKNLPDTIQPARIGRLARGSTSSPSRSEESPVRRLEEISQGSGSRHLGFRNGTSVVILLASRGPSFLLKVLGPRRDQLVGHCLSSPSGRFQDARGCTFDQGRQYVCFLDHFDIRENVHVE